MTGWPSTRPAGWRTWRTGRIVRGRVRIRCGRWSRSRSRSCVGASVVGSAAAGLRAGQAGRVDPVPSESAVYRALVRLNLIDPPGDGARDRKWKRWERGAPMELWQMDVVGGFVLADGHRAKALTGVDDHSRFCVQRPPDGAGVLPAGLRGAGEGAAGLRGARADPDRQRQGVHRPVQPAAGRGALRPGLPGERDRAPADPAQVADDDREDRAVPPGDPHRVPHRPGLRVPGRRPGRARRVGRRLQQPATPSGAWTWPPRPSGSTAEPAPVTPMRTAGEPAASGDRPR